jgi:hypothetical protein
LQDGWRPGRTAKPRPRKTLSPEPSCCLQDRAHGVFGPWFAGESGSGRWNRDAFGGIASSSRDSPPATAANCHCRLGGKPNPQPHGGDGFLVVSAAGTPRPRKPSARDEIWKGERDTDRTGRAAEAFLQGGEILFQPEICRNDFRNCCRVLPRPRQLGAFPQPPSEGVPPPASPLLKPLYWCTSKTTDAVQSLGGADSWWAEPPKPFPYRA